MRRAVTLVTCILFLYPAAITRAENAPVVWEAFFGTDGVTTAHRMIAASEGGVYIAGDTDTQDASFGTVHGGERDALVLRIGPDGKPLYAVRFGGSGDDRFTDVLETPDGGCVLIGTTTSTDGDARTSRGGTDGFIARLHADGSVKWIKCLGGTQDDELLSAAISSEGELLVCGRSKSRNGDLRANMGGWDAFAALLDDADGKPRWVIRYGQAGDDMFSNARATDDGWLLLGVIAEETAGNAADGRPVFRERPIALMISSENEEVFLTVLGGTGVNRIVDVQRTDSGWMFLGETNSSSILMPTPRGGLDVWLLHLRDTGTSTLFQRTFGGSSDESAHSFLPLDSGETVILATTLSGDGQVTGSHGSEDLWILSIAATGALQWQQTIGGGEPSTPAGMVRTQDGGYLVAGYTASQDGDIGFHASAGATGFIAKLAHNGNLIYTQPFSYGPSSSIHTMIQAMDGIYVAGSLHNGEAETLFVAKLDAD